MQDTYYAMSINQLFNGKMFQDKLLFPAQIPAYFPSFDSYLRFVTVNFGLEGLLTLRSPRELIEGYTDPLVATLNQMPVYLGGDNTTSPFLAMNKPPTHPDNNRIGFFTGQEDYEFTRTYGQWLGHENILMAGKEYVSLTDIQEYLFSPWEDDVLIDGSDGFQFSPDL